MSQTDVKNVKVNIFLKRLKRKKRDITKKICKQ